MANSDVIVCCGANNAENHPASMRHINIARERGAKFIVIDPRYTRTASVADAYYPMRVGTDITLFGGLINYLLQNDLYNKDYVLNWSNASYLISDTFSFEDGMFSGWTEADGKKSYDKTQWSYQVESETEWDTSAGAPYAWAKGAGVPEFTPPKVKVIKKDPTLEDPRCVFQLLKKHFGRYTSEAVEQVVGISQADFKEVCELVASTSSDDKSLVWLYAMGITQHTYGSQNIRGLSILQTLLGNMGVAGGGVAALRGESNVQGSTDFGLLFDTLPGYLASPTEAIHPTLRAYNETETIHSGYWSNKPKFLVSLLKEYWGDHATVENDFCYDYLPKRDGNYSFLSIFEGMDKGQVKGMFCWGMNPAVGGANVNFERSAMAKLDWLVCIDLFETDTAAFWENPLVEGEKAQPENINTEVFMLPAKAHLEKQGTVSNSGRWLQWRYKATEGPGEARDDGEIMTLLIHALQEEYKKDPGPFADPILNLTWDYLDEHGEFDVRLAARAINGYSTADKSLLLNLSKLQADGSTACICWILSGYYNNNDAFDDPTAQPCGARDDSDQTVAGLQGGLRQYPQWAWSWPMNRRIIYNRASTFKDTGKPRNSDRVLVSWNGSNWDRNDVPDFGFQTAVMDPTTGQQAVDAEGKPINVGNAPEKCPGFFMTGELVARLYAPGMNDGPFPEHYEPMESPVDNVLSGTQNNPAALVFAESSKFGSRDKYPILCTTWRVVEHWQTGAMTRNAPWLAEIMPHMFVEISEELAGEHGINNGDKVEVFNDRGKIEVYALVTKRVKPLTIDGKTVHQIGMPWHWGRKGMATGAPANVLTYNAGDANTFIPESKAFLVDIRKVG